MTKTMSEVLEEHYIDITVTSPDKIGSCVCGEWTAGTMSISWDEHQAAALSAAGFGLVADAGSKALEELAGRFDTYAANVSNNNHILNPLWEGLTDGYKRAAEHARAEAAAVRPTDAHD